MLISSFEWAKRFRPRFTLSGRCEEDTSAVSALLSVVAGNLKGFCEQVHAFDLTLSCGLISVSSSKSYLELEKEDYKRRVALDSFFRFRILLFASRGKKKLRHGIWGDVQLQKRRWGKQLGGGAPSESSLLQILRPTASSGG